MTPSAALQRGAALLYALMHERRRTMIRPVDRPVVRTGGDDAVRFLLIGNGLVHGWGVASHQLAPTGELARGFRTLTGRACEVEFVGDATMSAETALMWLDDRVDESFHGAVIAIGSNDALRFTSVADWELRLTELIDTVQRALPVAAPVVLVGNCDVFVPRRVRTMNRFAARHARRLDAASERIVAERPGVRFVALPSFAQLKGQEAHDVYGHFTTPIAVALADSWMRSDIATLEPGRAEEERFERHEVRSVVEASRWDEVPQLAALVQRAKERFGVSESAITLLDGDKTFHVASNGMMPSSMPKSLSYCETVVRTDAPLVVEDSTKDERFSQNAYLDLVHARFYAGIPLHAADGTTIGSFCLVNGFARQADSVDLAALAEFAREAETALTAIAQQDEPVPAGPATA